MNPFLDKTILASRWLLAVFYFGLIAGLAVYAMRFLYKLGKFALDVVAENDSQMLINLLHLLDSALVASLVVVVALASYNSLVSQLMADEAKPRIPWAALVDPGNLKIKLATALIAISAIHLLQIVMQVRDYDDRTIFWSVAIHGMFLLGVTVLGVLDWLAGAGKRGKP
jgi:uncharacterized protein (TIGR00645 family)